ncbi:MAG: GGDEF domain-containing protein [Ruminococcaceae bacterium]|nr:GGDEF domain-containing protein [Oscillospiraceae bacterium]
MLHGKKILGVCTSRIHSPLANTLIKTLDQKLRPHGYSIFAYTTNSDLFNNSPNDIGESSVFELMNYDVIDVLLVMCESFLNQPVLERIISRAQKHNVPVITFGGEFKGCIKPYFDYKAGMEQVVRHVIEHHGCRDLHFMAGFKDNVFSEERIAVFKDVIAEHGIPFDDSMLSYGDFWSQPTIAATEKLVARGSLPEAIICANDSMAVNVCAVLMKHGYRIPEDVIVTGFDGIDDVQIARPTITTCTCSHAILANEIADMIIDGRINTENGFEHALMPSIALAQSCGCVTEVGFDPTEHLAKLNDRFFRYQADEHNLFQMSANIINSKNLNEIFQIMDKAGFYDTTCVLRQECIDETIDPLTIPEDIDDEYRYLLFDTDAPRPFEPYRFKSSEVFPGIEKLIETGDPLFFTSLNYLNVPQGFLCLHYHNYDIDNYYSIPQTQNIMNNAIGCFRNMRYQQFMRARMEEIYAHDRLTGLYNRNALVNYYDENEAKLRSGNKDITFILCDLDRLKYTNDTFGHSEGDYALRAVADALRVSVPDNAMVARWGGDEMVALVIGDFDEAEMRKSIIAHLEEVAEGKPYEITASVGVVTVKPNELISLDDITKASDKLMYEEKQRKRKMRTT